MGYKFAEIFCFKKLYIYQILIFYLPYMNKKTIRLET